MKGNNELHLNTATMIEAVQQWIDGQMPNGAPTVTGIKPRNDNTASFVVNLSSDADRPGPMPTQGGKSP